MKDKEMLTLKHIREQHCYDLDRNQSLVHFDVRIGNENFYMTVREEMNPEFLARIRNKALQYFNKKLTEHGLSVKDWVELKEKNT